MFKYDKKLPYPVNIKRRDVRMAKYIITQFGGSAGELGAFLRYFCHKFTMPTDEGKALLNDIGVEELGHCEMVCAMISQLLKGASVKELEEHGLTANYVEHGLGVYPSDSTGNPFSAETLQSSGCPITDLSENMAAEAKAKIAYEHLIDITDDEDIIQPLLFLRQREIVHHARFLELYKKYKEMGY